MQDPRLLSAYPFLREASRYVADEGPDLEGLLTDPAYGRARTRGRDRLVAAVRDGELPARRNPDAADALVDLLGYGISRMLVSLADDAYVVKRHALAEASRVKALLDGERPDVVEQVARDVGLHPEWDPEKETWRLHFTEYLRYAVVLKDPAWKLVNQAFADPGHVELKPEKLTRLVQEALRVRIESELPRPVNETIATALAAPLAAVVEAAEERKALQTEVAFGEVDLELIPPCMKHILGELQSGVNAAHSARFAITSFLNTIGLDADAIIELFAKAPDFREDLTRYQVEHITGVTSDTAYTPPGCQAMKTYGICYNPDSRCKATAPDGHLYVTHPLSYYRWALKDKANGRLPARQEGGEESKASKPAAANDAR